MSIRQNSAAFGGPADAGGPRLPDFANLGVWLRVLLGVNALALLAALAANRQLTALPGELLRLAVAVEPPLIAALLILRLLRRPLLALPGRHGGLLVLGVALNQTVLDGLSGQGDDAAGLGRALFWTALSCLAMQVYFDLRARGQAPAIAEARLMALTARIRPHFLFNSLNAVLGVIRSEPRRAEAALEELADLFRVLMRENRELVPLSEEIALARQYLSLERLRLGERLQVHWDVEAIPPDALMPPLMLQPLLENAVYHGIEPLQHPGDITIRFARQGDELIIEMTNPYAPEASQHAGNQMALGNIRERLMLFYDLDARLEAQADTAARRYSVRIVIPYRHGARP